MKSRISSWRLAAAARRTFFVLTLAGVAVSGAPVLAGQATPAAPATSPASSATASADPTYGGTLPISAGDLVQIDVFGSPELSGRYRVSQTGDVDLILGGRFHIAGLSAGDAAAQVESILRDKQIVLAPHVSVFVREYASQGVTILGEVKNPGVYPSLGEHRLYDLIAAAGGFTASASNKITILHQADGGRPQTLELSNMGLTDGADDVPLGPGDRVVVGSGGIVYVIGDVGRPGGFVLSRTDSRLTVLKVLSLAAGVNQTAKLKAATILTQTPAGLVHKDIDLRELLRHRAPDPLLNAGDVLYVPTSITKVVGYRSLEAIFAAAATTAGVIAANR